jgi:predicted lysophospholipase L1 biosynthesis ABC-type transport system permease subunit
MRIPVLSGRDVRENEGEAMLVSRDVAKMYWGTDEPIGHRAALISSPTVLREVVGVVGEVKQRNILEVPTPTAYFVTREPYGRATFAIRTSVPPDTLAQPAAAVIRAIDPEQPVGEIKTMMQARDRQLTSQSLSALLLALFAVVALLLAALGIYSMLSYIVRGWSREIGIRTALGARQADVLRLVILESMAPTLVGIAAGAIAALVSAKAMQTLVFGIRPSDPLTMAGAGVTLALVALTASAIPAYRALRLDPVKALRTD